MSARVCVAGATGYLGARVVAQLHARGIPVTAIVRREQDGTPSNRLAQLNRLAALNRLKELGAELAFIDASRHESYRDALLDVDTAISCMASRNVHVDATTDFWAIDRDANIRYALAAVHARVRQVILVATFEGPASRRSSGFSEAKEQAVDAIKSACQAARIRFTVVRPTAYFSDLTNRAFDSVDSQSRYTEIGDGSHRINPVDGDDVAAFIAARVLDGGDSSGEFPVGGPDVLTFRQIGELAAEILGKQQSLRIKEIPVGMLRVAAALASVAGLCSLRMRRLAAIIKWMIYAGTHDALAPSCGSRRLRDDYIAKRAADHPLEDALIAAATPARAAREFEN